MTPESFYWLGCAAWLRDHGYEWLVRERPDEVVAIAEAMITVYTAAGAR